jgi:predicted enzyme related to lactoylglutathione lyase
VAVQRVDVGLVSTDEALVDFYADVFELERLPPVTAGPGVVHRLRAPGMVLKVMVPKRPPAAAEPVRTFFAVTGLRYLTLAVTDLDGVIDRAAPRGGNVQHGPVEVGGGVRIAVLADPDGNAVELVEGAP